VVTYQPLPVSPIETHSPPLSKIYRYTVMHYITSYGAFGLEGYVSIITTDKRNNDRYADIRKSVNLNG